MIAEPHRGPVGPRACLPPGVVAALFAAGVAVAPIGVAEPAGNADCTVGGFAGCDNNGMAELVRNAESMAAQYLSGTGIPASSLPRLVYIPSGRDAPSNCVDANGNDVQHDRSLDYCLTDNAVYVGQSSLWDAVQQYGAAGPTSGLAHEYGHFLQSVKHVPIPGNTAEGIRHENQADCVSGDFMSYLRNRGDIDVAADALDSVDRYLVHTASADVPGRDHGTATERTTSFRLGYDGGLAACNAFYPATPLTG